MISGFSIIRSVGSIILYLLLFLSCFNFLGRGPVFFLAFSLFCIMTNTKRYWNDNSLLYLLLSAFAVLASLVYYEWEEIIKAFVLFLSFYAGICFYNSSLDKAKRLNWLLFFGVLGFVANLMLTAYVNFVVIGHVEGERTLINPWTLDLLKVTIVGLTSCVPIAYSFYCIFCRREIFMKVMGVTFLSLSIWINMQTATRTPFVLAGIVCMVMIYEIRKSINVRKLFIALLFVGGFLLIHNYMGIRLESDSESVSESVSESAIANRFSDDGMRTSRWDITKYYMSQMSEYPWGGGFVYKHYHRMAHNIIQETYDYYGIFFFLTLILILIGIFGRIIKLHRIKRKTVSVFLILSIYISVLIQIMLEPVFVGYPQLLFFLFLIDGIVVGALADKKNNILCDNII